jgi:hypothetical protein
MNLASAVEHATVFEPSQPVRNEGMSNPGHRAYRTEQMPTDVTRTMTSDKIENNSTALPKLAVMIKLSMTTNTSLNGSAQ